jgi:hypothetical protein
MSKETEGKSVFDEEMLNRQLEAIKSLYNTAIDDAIKVVIGLYEIQVVKDEDKTFSFYPVPTKTTVIEELQKLKK